MDTRAFSSDVASGSRGRHEPVYRLFLWIPGIQRRSIKLATVFVVVASASALCAQETTRGVTVVAPTRLEMPQYDNFAGLALDILPSAEFPIGSKVAFKLTANKPGYLILIDVDANGKVSQRYPNLLSMTLPQGANEAANFIEPGKTVLIPDLRNPFAHFEYVAEPPEGPGLIMALLSPKPVHVVDLPDVPRNLAGQPAAADFLKDAARNLRIAPREAQAPLQDPNWSFVVKPYSIIP
jgi:hypothetical protein